MPSEGDVVLALDVGGSLVKTAVVGPGRLDVQRLPTATASEPWNVERLERIAADLHAAAVRTGATPACLVVAVPGQVDEYHGAVQYSATLPWHDVAVADRLGAVVPVPVVVRHAVRVAALGEANLRAASVVEGTLLFVSIGASIVAAGASSGIVVADHVGAGDLGGMRIRSGPTSGLALDEVASTTAIARRYAEASGVAVDSVDAADVHRALATDPVARQVWDEAVDALADGLEWSLLLFAPRAVVIGGGLVNAGDDLMNPLIAGVTRRLEEHAIPDIRAAAFGDDAGLVGAALAGWRKLGWPVETLRAVFAARFENRE
ncbi:MAG TPA: ROK family protein [Acidimicrobiales bacterium]|nr:ROK family protein [Acidimicrobiales bacterium]